MKKILLLFILCVIKLSAYEYLFFVNESTGFSNSKLRFFIDSNNNQIIVKAENFNDTTTYQSGSILYTYLNAIKFHTYRQYILKSEFDNILKSDLVFLNDWYTKETNYILNYYYNESPFSALDNIIYSNYELLYNGEGLAVASIFNDQWAGLYDNETRYASGKLYDKTGTLQYINGKAVQQMSPFDMINELFIVSVQEVFGLISRTMCYVIGVAVVLVFAAFLFILDLLHSSLSVRERLGSPWVATFDEKGKRVSKWGRNPNYFYHGRFSGDRNFAGWRDYQEYERKLSNDSSSSNFRKKVF